MVRMERIGSKGIVGDDDVGRVPADYARDLPAQLERRKELAVGLSQKIDSFYAQATAGLDLLSLPSGHHVCSCRVGIRCALVSRCDLRNDDVFTGGGEKRDGSG